MSSETTPRRDFLAQLAAAGLVSAGLSTVGCSAAAQGAAVGAAPAPGAGATAFDDAWTTRVRAASSRWSVRHTCAQPRKKRCSGVKPSIFSRDLPS